MMKCQFQYKLAHFRSALSLTATKTFYILHTILLICLCYSSLENLSKTCFRNAQFKSISFKRSPYSFAMFALHGKPLSISQTDSEFEPKRVL